MREEEGLTPDISIIVPVFRNAATLWELYGRVCRTLDGTGLSLEMIFVNDACPEDSLAVLREIAAADHRVVVLALARNVGQHQAVLTGLTYARGEWAAVLDGDLQDPPEALPALLSRGQSGFAAVFAGRRGRYESLGRLFTSRLFKWTLHLLTGVPADAGMFCLLHRRMVEKLLAMGGRRPSIVAMIGSAGLPMTSAPVERAPRPVGRSAYSSRGRLISAWLALTRALGDKLRTRTGRSASPAVTVPIEAVYGRQFVDPGERGEIGFRSQRQ